MKVHCSYSGCSDRRVHHDNPYVNRPHVVLEVPDDHVGPYYCSFECAAYDGAYSFKTGWKAKPDTKTTID
jgi:hypothetical protein